MAKKPSRLATLTAKNAGLLHCHVCGALSRLPCVPKVNINTRLSCPYCHSHSLWDTQRHSMQTTWALLLAAMVMFIPANTMPIMSFYILGKGSPSTIVEGVLQLIALNQWPIAIIIFLASIVVPLAKILALVFLLVSIQKRSTWRPRERMLLYKSVEFIGRWSMIDIFVVAVLVGVVQFGNLAYVEANIGSLSFATVVILTMLAARTLDEHLIWLMTDSQDNKV